MSTSRLSRRAVLGAGAGTGTLLAAALTPSAQAASTTRGQRSCPNFLVFFSEDNNPYNGAYGDVVARTPNIDQLAGEGIRFDVAYSAAPVCAPSRFAFLTGLYPETAGPAHHMRAVARMPDTVRAYSESMRAAGYYATNSSKTDYNADIDMTAAWDESGATAHWRNRPAADTPFLAQFTTMTNHESSLFEVADGNVRPEEVRVPAYLPDTPEVRRGIAHSYNVQEKADAELGRRLAELEEDGLAEDTIVIYLGDNGGALPWSKRFANDNGLHIPFIVRVPPRWQHLVEQRPGSRITTPINGVDLPATVLSLAGVPVPDHVQGQSVLGRRAVAQEYAYGERSRMDERYDLQRTVRDERFVYIRNYMPHRPYGQHMAYMWQQVAYQVWQQEHLEGTLNPVQDRFWGTKPFEELYDLTQDPDQVQNLVDEPRHRRTLNRLRRALDDHIMAVNDNGFIPESHPVEGYVESRVPGAYPIEEVMAVAARAPRRDPSEINFLLRDLAHENDIVRYWAATGFLAMGEEAGDLSVTLAEAFAAEESMYVRIPLAEALARLGHPYHSVAFLADVLENDPNARVQLQAINALTYVGTAALPYRNVIAASVGVDEYLKNAGTYLSAVFDGTYTPTTQVYSPF
ncbi:sulfatase-like hydrolase/transferase [Kineococcus arenarius]|uniref:sulfatase-like hydrolase/transferase n=1 Tax=Kineococcus sp. SYSU DK020 TaxID=3383141 RepID=UPI003D7C88A1